jgi:competence protein ComEC
MKIARAGQKARLALRLAGGFLFGFFWAAAFALYYLSDELPRELEGKDIIITGTIHSLPKLYDQNKSFIFKVEQSKFNENYIIVPPRILLSWNAAFQPENAPPVPDVQPGSRWQLNVRLRRPHGNVNPDGFDYEVWLLKQGIRATGYVRYDGKADVKNRMLDNFVPTPCNVVNRARSHLREHIRAALPDARYAGVIVALVMGDQQGIDASDWDLFNCTGISHLVSISGLHITLISGMFAAFVAFLWRHSFFTGLALPLLLPARKVAALAGALMACGYVLLAGFGLPAQRTLYMLLIVAAALWMGRVTRVSPILCAALGVVLLVDPWAVLSPGFWLSFGAVGIILYITVGRKNRLPPDAGKSARWRQAMLAAARTQLAITLGLVPLTLLFFGRISLISPLANAIAIPLVGMVVTPMALVGGVMPSFLARWLLGAAHWLVEVLAAFLNWLGAFSFAVWNAPLPSAWCFFVALLGTLWMLAPRGWPARWLGLPCWFPLLLAVPAHPPEGEAQAIALDTGQGSAVLVETRHHRMLYDTGPAYSPRADAGTRVIIPYLNARGIDALDAVVISHGDKDHAGGAASLLAYPDIPVRHVYSPLKPDDPLLALAKRHDICLEGLAWEWDGVSFEMLGPTEAGLMAAKDKKHANAASCVLKITAGRHSMILPGDIGIREEADLLARMPERLKADILLAPHHGSKSSSSQPFLEAVAPSLAIFQAGYRNRYGHPHSAVYKRYGMLGATRVRTDEAGAVIVRFGDGVKASEWRKEHARYWYGR